MNFNVKKENKEYELGFYFMDKAKRVFRIILDKDRGYGLLDVSTSKIESDYYEELHSLVSETTLGSMKRLKQVNEVEFEEV